MAVGGIGDPCDAASTLGHPGRARRRPGRGSFLATARHLCRGLHPRIAFSGYEGRAADDAGTAPGADRRRAGIPEALVVEFDHAFLAAESPEELVERVPGSPLGNPGRGGRRKLPLRPGPRRGPGDAAAGVRDRRARQFRSVEGVSSSRDPRPSARRRDRARGQASRPPAGARRARRWGRCARRARSGSRPRTCAFDPLLLVPAYGIYAGAALDHRAAISIGTNPALRRRRAARRGPSCSTSRAISTGSGSSSSSGDGCATRGKFEERGGAGRADRARRGGDARRRRPAEPSARAAPLRRGSPAQPVRVTAPG